ncbi:LPS assembly lipoprotein LptE [Wenxinia marina]|uniref:Putative secreted (Periplasmic) protein n=1 Tax=Wenxinia marina DSM 24838 TaxID=1123501 RepID=A0A0D0NQ23_9RHOB|nr:LPS assembly lipoprotein LptE [Wenxinia marina]KIQ70375.1 putative secreted (periplasmic) protein [Wenxinia marina DSM 24838]GGL53667.1 hypothetical protein GCM10011392_05020 [Wenxinia marina]
MWWPEGATRRGAVLALLALGACGFTPVYAPGGPGEVLRGQVAYATPATPAGYRLRARLEDRLGRNEGAPLGLTVTLEIADEATAIGADGAQTRFTLLGRAPWRLESRPDGAVIAEGVADAFTAYSATGSTVATEAAARDARDRLAVILADQIVTRLLALSPDLAAR